MKSRIIAVGPFKSPIKRYRILRFGSQNMPQPHCRIGRIKPTEQGLRCKTFMEWLYLRPLKWPTDWTMGRFMRID